MYFRCVDAHSQADLKVFLERAERLGAAEVRLQAMGETLLSTVPVLSGNGLGSLRIIAMRVSAIAAGGDADHVVAIRSILERIARLDGLGEIAWPPATLTAAWAGITPPRIGWEPLAELDAEYLAESAEHTLGALAGISSTAPEQLLAEALSSIDPQLNAPVGLAAAAQSLGFLAGTARLARNGRWLRLSTTQGHVLSHGA